MKNDQPDRRKAAAPPPFPDGGGDPIRRQQAADNHPDRNDGGRFRRQPRFPERRSAAQLVISRKRRPNREKANRRDQRVEKMRDDERSDFFRIARYIPPDRGGKLLLISPVAHPVLARQVEPADIVAGGQLPCLGPRMIKDERAGDYAAADQPWRYAERQPQNEPSGGGRAPLQRSVPVRENRGRKRDEEQDQTLRSDQRQDPQRPAAEQREKPRARRIGTRSSRILNQRPEKKRRRQRRRQVGEKILRDRNVMRVCRRENTMRLAKNTKRGRRGARAAAI